MKVVDTTGSGDVFTGALLSQLLQQDFSLEQKELEPMLRFACAAGSLCGTRYGGIPAIPQKEEIENFLKTHNNN